MDPQKRSALAQALKSREPWALEKETENVFGMKPGLDRGNVLPLPDGDGGIMVPQWLYEMGKAVSLPGHVMRGGDWSPEDVTNMALTVGGSAGAASMAGGVPKGALAMGAVKRGADDLSMDTASRMARAKEMGFDVENHWYHGSPDARGINENGFSTLPERMNGLDQEGPYFFTDNSRVASSYADDRRAFDYQNAEPEVIQAYVKDGGNDLVIDAKGAQFRGIKIEDLLEAFPDGPAKDNLKLKLSRSPEFVRDGVVSTDNIGALAKQFGKSGVVIRNVRDSYSGEGPKSTVRMVFGANNIRRPTAKFDPSKADSADLLAASGSPAGLLATPREDEPKQPDAKQMLMHYLNGGA